MQSERDLKTAQEIKMLAERADDGFPDAQEAWRFYMLFAESSRAWPVARVDKTLGRVFRGRPGDLVLAKRLLEAAFSAKSYKEE